MHMKHSKSIWNLFVISILSKTNLYLSLYRSAIETFECAANAFLQKNEFWLTLIQMSDLGFKILGIFFLFAFDVDSFFPNINL